MHPLLQLHGVPGLPGKKGEKGDPGEGLPGPPGRVDEALVLQLLKQIPDLKVRAQMDLFTGNPFVISRYGPPFS